MADEVVIHQVRCREPDLAVRHVGGLDHKILGHFSLQADGPLILAARTAGVLVNYGGWAGTYQGIHREVAGAEIRPHDLLSG